MEEKYITLSYWVLFIIIPALIVGVAVYIYSLSMWVLAGVTFCLFIAGEHGLRAWAKYWTESKK
ncbi:hypothetical protein [Pseudoalteromonas ardens]|uniref:Uncharacterized protein n=1 Tax=Pseudoalteromonas rubra TaxID=43658 RepID=A0A0L0ER04_9GAMM|nr:hypothetical protein [Pseudoalteromonas sp. R96]KNC66323.1 hypothetical protein AC626_17690 [Pseudoalteromonas rubra]MDK1312796.1 hypothetical protein [Pseudoalteromonas sp. R96]